MEIFRFFSDFPSALVFDICCRQKACSSALHCDLSKWCGSLGGYKSRPEDLSRRQMRALGNICPWSGGVRLHQEKTLHFPSLSQRFIGESFRNFLAVSLVFGSIQSYTVVSRELWRNYVKTWLILRNWVGDSALSKTPFLKITQVKRHILWMCIFNQRFIIFSI